MSTQRNSNYFWCPLGHQNIGVKPKNSGPCPMLTKAAFLRSFATAVTSSTRALPSCDPVLPWKHRLLETVLVPQPHTIPSSFGFLCGGDSQVKNVPLSTMLNETDTAHSFPRPRLISVRLSACAPTSSTWWMRCQDGFKLQCLSSGMDPVTAPGLYIDPINKDLCVLGNITQLLWVILPSTAKWEAWS